MYENYVFDLYGTLIDIHTDEYSKNFYKQFAKWLRRNGYAFTWREFKTTFQRIEREYRSAESDFEKPEIDILKVFADTFLTRGYILNKDELEKIAQSFRWISLIYFKLFPDTLECLEGLKKAGKKIYLLSNAQRSFTYKELELAGLITYFDGILISSDESCMKPDPMFFDILCKRYNLDKAKSIMIGNELKSDMAGAQKYGMDSFYIKRNFKSEDISGCTYVSKNGSLLQVLNETGVK